eukprot:TRINITY_DN5103_c0_g2_i2.p2 TRINITY_DN5103_c0_g2~~TRINITY_DN5103_c0_g2_i2.p2  ORF type:complete len:231 (-),score=52.65 TRINITY_DN5103_c0_g2_i2:177-869(-)
MNNSMPSSQPIQTNSSTTKTERKSSCSCTISTILAGDTIIVVPKPIRATGPNWMDRPRVCAREELGEAKDEGGKWGQERAKKVRRFLEKRRKRNGVKKIRYQYRQQVAARRIRFHGRFIKIEQAKELILRGESVDANDKTELNKLFEELKESSILNGDDKTPLPKNSETDLKSDQNTILINNMGGMRKFSASTCTNSGTSPLIQVMRNECVENESKQCEDVESSPPDLKL